jgi:hypothetical protein
MPVWVLAEFVAKTRKPREFSTSREPLDESLCGCVGALPIETWFPASRGVQPAENLPEIWVLRFGDFERSQILGRNSNFVISSHLFWWNISC